MTTREAERLRRDNTNYSYAYEDGEDCEASYIEDVRALANAYLAEHPADEDAFIDETWLKSVGFGEPTINGWPIIFANNGCDPIELWLDYDGCVALIQSNSEDHVLIGKRCKTRGDLRRLAAAIGIELPTPATEAKP